MLTILRLTLRYACHRDMGYLIKECEKVKCLGKINLTKNLGPYKETKKGKLMNLFLNQAQELIG